MVFGFVKLIEGLDSIKLTGSDDQHPQTVRMGFVDDEIYLDIA